MSRQKLLFSCAFIIFAICLLSFSSGAPSGRTGAPGEATCAGTPCHRGGTFEGALEINGFPSALTAGQTFEVNVTLVSTGGNPVRGGFSLVGIGRENGEFVNVGTFSNPGTNTAIDDSAISGRIYLSHSPAKFFEGSDRVTYTAQWSTPTSFTTDTVTLYAAGVFADDNGFSNGDNVVFATQVMPVTNVGDADGDGFNSDLDCDDNNPDINPDAVEIINNDVDENCDGIVEIIDEDGDFFNSDEDCNDLNIQINPNATEI